MTTEAAQIAYDTLTIEMADEDGVTVTDEGLLVHGKRFAYPVDDDLIVALDPERITDLETRGIATGFSHGWLRVSDQQLWPELAREAHEFVGEPPVGGES